MSVKIIFRNEDEVLFWNAWEKYINQHQSSPRYTRLNLEWCLSISRARSLLVDDKSFVYVVNNEVQAVVFLPLEKRDGQVTASMIGGYIYAPLFSTELICRKVFALIDQIAQQYELTKVLFAIDPFSQVASNYLQYFNYLDTSILSYLIDLKVSDLLGTSRKSHRYQIRQMLHADTLETFVIDSHNPLKVCHDEYVELHHKCAGMVTRPVETFDVQFEKLKQGEAVLVGLRYKGAAKGIAYSYFEIAHGVAVYASGVDDPEVIGLPLYHLMVFAAMKHLQKRGITMIDTGQPVSPSPQFDYFPDHKQLNISLFKSGFGGEWRSYFRGIKYFNPKVAQKDLENWVSKYTSSLSIQKE